LPLAFALPGVASALPGAGSGLPGVGSALSGAGSALSGAPLLAAGQSTPTPPPAPASGQEFGSASTLGFVVLVLFFIAVAFLARSMAKHLKRIQKPSEEAEAAQAEQAANAEDPSPDEDAAPPSEAEDKPTDTKQHKADA
jgi:Sec-independent protein translocase protein TatA